jgi:hypothetical protein
MSVAFGYLLAVMTFLAISGTESTSSPSRWLRVLLVEDPVMVESESESAHQKEAEGSEEEEEESLDEVNTVVYCGLGSATYRCVDA